MSVDSQMNGLLPFSAATSMFTWIHTSAAEVNLSSGFNAATTWCFGEG